MLGVLILKLTKIIFILLGIWYPPTDHYTQENIISGWVLYNLENYVCLDISEILIADWDHWLCKCEITWILFRYPVVWASLSRQTEIVHQNLSKFSSNQKAEMQLPYIWTKGGYTLATFLVRSAYRNFFNSSRFQPEMSHRKKGNKALWRTCTREFLQARWKGLKKKIGKQ